MSPRSIIVLTSGCKRPSNEIIDCASVGLDTNASDTESAPITNAFALGIANGEPKKSTTGFEASSATTNNIPVPTATKMKGTASIPKKIRINRGPTTKRSFQPKIRCKTAPKIRTYNTIHVPQRATTGFARCLYQPQAAITADGSQTAQS